MTVKGLRGFQLFQSIGTHVLAGILSLLIFCGLPIILLIVIPILTYRKAISKLAKVIRPDLAKMLTHRSTVFSQDDMLSHTENLVIVSFTVEGNIPLETLKRIFTERILQLKLPNGEIRYPELMQHYEDWMGFRFWKNDDNFDVNHHIQTYNSCSKSGFLSDNELSEIRQALLNSPFRPQISPWEVLLIHNYQTQDSTLRAKTDQPMSIFMLKVHHGIGDGFSIRKLVHEGIINLSSPDPPKSPKAELERKHCHFTQLILTLAFPIRFIYDFSLMIILSRSGGKEPWRTSPGIKAPGFHGVTNTIPVERIKRIKNELNSSFSGVIFSICSGAIRRVMEKKGMTVSDSLPIIIPIPLPGHPDKLRNHL
jgi:hypothetical protein